MRRIGLYLLIFILPMGSSWVQASDKVHQTAFLIEPTLALDQMALPAHFLPQFSKIISGRAYPDRPPEWGDYIDVFAFEDLPVDCMGDLKKWRWVAARIIPFGVDEVFSQPQVRLAFQPFCKDGSNISSDTSLQLVLMSKDLQDESLLQLVKTYELKEDVSLSDAGFVLPSVLQKRDSFLPALLAGEEVEQQFLKIKELIHNQKLVVREIQWMSSIAGGLDWVFGRALWRNEKLIPQDLPVYAGNRKINLGEYDFLPLTLRNVYSELSQEERETLNLRQVTQDPHSSDEAAREVLAVDLRVSDPRLTNHQQSSCIQCHGAQERMEASMSGAKEFGYFFRGMGFMGDQPYISWRSVQESKALSEAIEALNFSQETVIKKL